MSDNFFTERQGAAVLKHGLLVRYLPIFASMAGSTAHNGRVAYIDTYAGPGMYDDGSPGSPAVAVATARKIRDEAGDSRLDGYLVERNPECYELLSRYIDQQGLPWPVLIGEADEHLPTIVEWIDPATPAFAFLDPFGLGLPLEMIQKLLLARAGTMRWGRRDGTATEVLLNFSYPGLHRTAGQLTANAQSERIKRASATIVAKVDTAFGGDWWQEIWCSDLSSEERDEVIRTTYGRRLVGDANGWMVLSVPVADQPGARPSYALMFLTQHMAGVWEFINSLSGAFEDYDRAFLPEVDPKARDAQYVSEIADNIRSLLEEQSSLAVGSDIPSIARVYGEVLGRAREKHIRGAVKRLHAEGVTSTTGVGGKVRGMVVTRA